jgi:hypothetical protein
MAVVASSSRHPSAMRLRQSRRDGPEARDHGEHTLKVNDTYFNTPTYDTTPWRNLVMCQEVGHTLGLDHQDTSFDNPNLGTCMDYASNPLGPPDNEHPNKHDYDISMASSRLPRMPRPNAAS